MTVVMINNNIYGMTGGQVAPTSPYHAYTRTSPYGNPEMPFDACSLAITCGATYVARWTVGHSRQITKAFKEAIEHPGFSFLEILTPCPTQTGRLMKKSAPELLKHIRENVTKDADKVLVKDEVRVGRLHWGNRPEFTDVLSGLMKGDKE